MSADCPKVWSLAKLSRMLIPFTLAETNLVQCPLLCWGASPKISCSVSGSMGLLFFFGLFRNVCFGVRAIGIENFIGGFV